MLVELPHAGNIRMLGNLLGDPQQEVTIGAAVEAVFEPHDDATDTLYAGAVAHRMTCDRMAGPVPGPLAGGQVQWKVRVRPSEFGGRA